MIEKRLAKADFELSHAPAFDHRVVNDDLDDAVKKSATSFSLELTPSVGVRILMIYNS